MTPLISYSCCLIFLFLHCTLAYRILGVFPHHGYSHFIMFEPLMLELASRGHEVVVISRFPQSKSVKNYFDIDVNTDASVQQRNLTFQMLDQLPVSLLEDLAALYRYFLQTEDIFKTSNFKNFMNKEQKFDLLITESFNTRLICALAYKFRIPFITLSSCAMFYWTSYDIANPINPSYIPSLLSYQSSKMNFFQRLDNTLVSLISIIHFEFFLNHKAEEFKIKYFGEDIPPLRDISRNTSLTIVNSHFTLHSPRPLVPGIIEVGGAFIKSSKPLSEDLEKFINESKHGVIYFCMGSLLRGETFPEEKRNAFLYAFSKIPQRVLWKWEGDELPGKSDNIMISKWMPQRDILAHPNIKLFISHGGLLGTSEAVYEGVPILGIPIFGDQRTNIKAIESNGAGELLDYNDITKETVLEKIQRLVNDPKYQENAKQLSLRYRDRPMSPLDTAVYWTEYVIRHKGAPHLKSAAVDMPWYQYLLLDVIAFLIVAFISLILILYYTVKIILKVIYNLVSSKKYLSKTAEKEKKN